MTENSVPEPKQPPIGKFESYERLVAFYDCWARARGDKMLPSKQDFEREVLNYPIFLPDMVMVELGPDGEFLYRYVGSQIVTRRDSEPTGMSLADAHAPKAGKLMHDWALASLKIPHLNFHKAHTQLPSRAMAESANLSVVLSDRLGHSSYIAATTVVGEAYRVELERGGFLVGSAGLEMYPIDIGYGVPDLPRTVV